MKYGFFVFLAFFFCDCVHAQQGNGTQDDGFLLRLHLPNGSTPLFENKSGGYGYAEFGGEVLEEMEGEVAWARTTTGDSLSCFPVANDLSGKIALVRRGECSFSLKCFWAQQAGAKAVVLINHYDLPSENEHTIMSMPPGMHADSVTIPCIFVCRKVGELITGAIDNGQPLTARFVFRSLKKATAAYHFATPKSQVDTLKHITTYFFNSAADTIYNVAVRADITEPDGNMVSLSVTVASLAPRQDTLLFFPHYLPPAVLGDFEVTFSNTAFNESEDSIKHGFQITEHTWAADNGKIKPGGIPWDFSAIDPPPNLFQPGALYRTGPNGGTITSAVFGIVGVDTLLAQDENFSVGVFLFDADANDDGTIDFPNNNWSGWDDLSFIAWGSYKLTGNEAKNEMVLAPIKSLFPDVDSIFLEPRHWYYLCLVHSPDFGLSYIPPRFSITEKVQYFDFPSDPYQLYNIFFSAGFPDFTIAQRLSTKQIVETGTISHFLDPSRFAIRPNPADDFLQIELNLSAVNKKIAVSMLDWQGRVMLSEKGADFQQGTISFNVQDLPSGVYLLWIRTEEGSAIRQVMICH